MRSVWLPESSTYDFDFGVQRFVHPVEYGGGISKLEWLLRHAAKSFLSDSFLLLERYVAANVYKDYKPSFPVKPDGVIFKRWRGEFQVIFSRMEHTNNSIDSCIYFCLWTYVFRIRFA